MSIPWPNVVGGGTATRALGPCLALTFDRPAGPGRPLRLGCLLRPRPPLPTQPGPHGPQAVLQARAHHLGATSTPQAPNCAFGLSCSPRPSLPTKGPLSPLRPGLPSRQGPAPQDPRLWPTPQSSRSPQVLSCLVRLRLPSQPWLPRANCPVLCLASLGPFSS